MIAALPGHTHFLNKANVDAHATAEATAIELLTGKLKQISQFCFIHFAIPPLWQLSGSVVECLTPD